MALGSYALPFCQRYGLTKQTASPPKSADSDEYRLSEQGCLLRRLSRWLASPRRLFDVRTFSRFGTKVPCHICGIDPASQANYQKVACVASVTLVNVGPLFGRTAALLGP